MMTTNNQQYFHDQLAGVVPPISSTKSLPPISYSDAAIFELEKEHIFSKSWLGLGRADQLLNSGDFSTLEIVGMPIIIVRDNQNQLRAFANSCRHRGAKLLTDSGNCQVIRCPFHRWTYALDGRLLTAPKIKNDERFDYSQYGLIELPMAQRHGFAFVSFNQNVKDIDEWLGDFEQYHAPWNLEDLVSFKRHEFEVNCNWKAFLDVFNEYYHLPYVHPDSINSVYLAPEPPDKVSGNYATQFGATDGTGGLLVATQQHSLPKIDSLDSKNANGARYSWLFPNMTFAAGTESVWIYEAFPLTPQRSRIVLTLCFPEKTTRLENFEHSAKYYFDRLIAAIDEDIPALENQQKGLNSPLAVSGRYCEALEPNVANFAFWYAAQFN